MADMLVKLYALPDRAPRLAAVARLGLVLRRPHRSERDTLAKWVRQHFTDAWASGCEAALERRTPTAFVATEQTDSQATATGPYDLPAERLVGFACYDVAAKGMFGPLGVRADYRGRGIGTALLLASLQAMKDEGYAYAVIGWAGSLEFYAKAAGATVIPDSEPGIFRGPLVR